MGNAEWGECCSGISESFEGHFVESSLNGDHCYAGRDVSFDDVIIGAL